MIDLKSGQALLAVEGDVGIKGLHYYTSGPKTTRIINVSHAVELLKDARPLEFSRENAHEHIQAALRILQGVSDD
jgi:hypothetical protein